MTITTVLTDQELELFRDKYIAFGYLRKAKSPPRKEEIANMALEDWGQGDVFEAVVDQLGLVAKEVDGCLVYQKNPLKELEKLESLERYKCASSKPNFERNPDLQHKSMDELLRELKLCHDVYGVDGEHDPDRIEDVLWMLCYRIASVIQEDHCDLIAAAALAIAYQHKVHPTAGLEWKDAGLEMCERVLEIIYSPN